MKNTSSELPSSLIDVDPRVRTDLALRLAAQIDPLAGLMNRLMANGQAPAGVAEHPDILRVGKRLVLGPLDLVYDPRPGEIVMRLNPGLAFGTGHHPTTRTCLCEMEEHLRHGDRVLDVGTGSGILAIAAVKLGAASVYALDNDGQAVVAARANARDNGVGRAVMVRCGSVPLGSRRQYQVVVANLSARLVSTLAGALADATALHGTLIASGFMTERATAVAESLSVAGFRIVRVVDDSEWATVTCERVN